MRKNETVGLNTSQCETLVSPEVSLLDFFPFYVVLFLFFVFPVYTLFPSLPSMKDNTS